MIHQNLVKSLLLKQPNKSLLLNELESLLNTSRRAVRNRLNNHTPFNLDDLELIINHYKIDLSLIVSKDIISPITKEEKIKNGKEFIDDVLNSWTKAVEYSASKKEFQFYLVTNNFPILLAMKYPELIKLKVFLLAKLQWRHPDFINGSFDLNHSDFSSVNKFASRINRVFEKTPSIEIWGPTVFVSFLKQIDLLIQMNAFNEKNQLYSIINQLEKLIHRCKKYSLFAKKQLEQSKNLRNIAPEFKLYYNDILTVDEYTLLNWQEGVYFKSIAYHAIFGFLKNQIQIEKVESYVSQIKNTSVIISENTNQYKNIFFSSISKQVEEYKNKWNIDVRIKYEGVA